MEKSIACISPEIFIMKKTLTGLVAFLLIGIATKAQSEKEIKTPPPPPKIMVDEKVKEPPVITVKGKMADEFYKRNPSVVGISRQRNIITLKKQDGAIEKYDMAKKEEDKSFTEKYGVSPIPPPPPPPKKSKLDKVNKYQSLRK
jgi:hypothetical protein